MFPGRIPIGRGSEITPDPRRLARTPLDHVHPDVGGLEVAGLGQTCIDVQLGLDTTCLDQIGRVEIRPVLVTEQFPHPALGAGHLLAGHRGRGALDRDVLGESRALLGRRHLQDAVEVEVHPAEDLVAGRHSREPLDQEAADQDVVERVRVVALVHGDLPRLLVVHHRQVGLGAAHRERTVADDDRPVAVLGRTAVEEPEERRSERVRRDVDQHPVDVVPRQPRGQHARAQGDAQLRMQFLPGHEPGPVLEERRHERRPGGAAHEEDVVDLVRPLARVAERRVDAVERALDEVVDELLVLLPGDLQVQVQGNTAALGQMLLDDPRVGLEAQPLLGVLHRVEEPAHRPAVRPDVDAARRHEPAVDVVQQEPVEVVASEVVVAVARQHLGHVAVHLDERHVERAPAEIVDEDRPVALAVGAVGERRGGRLVENAHHLESRDLAGVARRLALRVREVGGHGDDRPAHGLAERGLGPVLQGAKDHRRDLRRRVRPGVQGHPLIGAHEPLDRLDGALGIHDELVAGRGAHEQRPVRREAHDGRHDLLAVRRQHFHLAVDERRHLGVRRPEIDAHDEVVHANVTPWPGAVATLTSANRMTRPFMV